MLIESLFILLAGLSFGSFVTLASYRLPLDEDVVFKPSRCPKCDVRLGFRDLWPVLSWLAFKGRCRHCQAKISARYPLTEIATAALFLLIYWRCGFTLQAGLLMLMGVALMVMIVADLEHYIIPDEVHMALLPLALIYHYVMGSGVTDMLGGFALGLAIGLALQYGYRYLRKREGLGFGDVKFLAVAGLWLGVRPIVPFLFLAGIFGIATGLLWRAIGRGQVFPFGPSLALSLLVCVAFPELPKLFWNIGQFVALYK